MSSYADKNVFMSTLSLSDTLEKLGKLGGIAVAALGSIAAALSEALEQARAQGYQEGYADGELAAKTELVAVRRQLRAILGDDAVDEPRTDESHEAQQSSILRRQSPSDIIASRAPRGTNVPLVIDVLRASQKGMSPREVADLANIPENSARGSLNRLRHEGVVEKRQNLWFLALNKRAADGSAAH